LRPDLDSTSKNLQEMICLTQVEKKNYILLNRVIEYGRANENYKQCTRQYTLQYSDRQCPNHTTIMR